MWLVLEVTADDVLVILKLVVKNESPTYIGTYN